MLNVASIKRLLRIGSDRRDALSRLFAGSRLQLSASLKIMPPGETGWIGFDDTVQLFSPDGESAGRIDELSTFAADHRCVVKIEPTDNRVYFSKVADVRARAAAAG